jgi:hypothetical protein
MAAPCVKNQEKERAMEEREQRGSGLKEKLQFPLALLGKCEECQVEGQQILGQVKTKDTLCQKVTTRRGGAPRRH